MRTSLAAAFGAFILCLLGPSATIACTVMFDADHSADLARQRLHWDQADSVVLARLDGRAWLTRDHARLTWRTVAIIKGTVGPEEIHRMRHINGVDRECGFFPPERGTVVVLYLRRNGLPTRLLPISGWSIIDSDGPRFIYDPRIAEALRVAADRLRSLNR